MKILHIWDICDFGENISNFILDHDLGKSKVVKKKGMPIRFVLFVIWALIFYNPNIIHIHYWVKGVLLAKILCPRTPIIMHFHGDDLRGKKLPGYVKKYSSAMLVSTRDLLEEGDCFEYYGYPTW